MRRAIIGCEEDRDL